MHECVESGGDGGAETKGGRDAWVRMESPVAGGSVEHKDKHKGRGLHSPVSPHTKKAFTQKNVTSRLPFFVPL